MGTAVLATFFTISSFAVCTLFGYHFKASVPLICTDVICFKLLACVVSKLSDEASLFGFDIQELPEKWNNVKKQAVLVKQQVAPLQANEVANLRRKCATFDVEQHTFREQFRKIGFFRYST